MNKTFIYNSGCLAVIIRLFLTYPMFCDYNIEEKGLLLLCISKWLRRETSSEGGALLRACEIRHINDH